MENIKTKNKYIILLLGLVFLSLFLIYVLNFNIEINNLYASLAVEQLTVPLNIQKPITLFFVGDLMLDRGVEYQIMKEGNGDYKFPFLKIADYLKKADILFGNFEGPISDKGIKVGSIYSFRTDPGAIEGLVFAGFDILSEANNHVFDYGREAMEDTLLRLKEAGINYVGAGFNEKEAYSPVIKEVRGTKIAFLAYTSFGSEFWKATAEGSGISRFDEQRMKEEIKKAKDLADIVIVSFHYGQEYLSDPISFQTSVSRAAIDYGADLVVGHHPHVVQPIEEYKGGYIDYSLGNFVFDQSFSEETMEGLLLQVLIKDNKIEKVIPVKIKINEFFQPEIRKEL